MENLISISYLSFKMPNPSHFMAKRICNHCLGDKGCSNKISNFDNTFLKIGMEFKKRGYESSWRSACPVLYATEIQRLLENMENNMSCVGAIALLR